MKKWFQSTRFVGRNPHSEMESKSSGGASPLVALQLSSRALWTPRDYGALARQGYQKNAIAYRCVRIISEAAVSVPLCVRRGQECVTGDPAARFLGAGGPTDTTHEIMERFYGYLQVSGNAYLEAGLVDGTPVALYALRPDRMQVLRNAQGWVSGWDYQTEGVKRTFPRDMLSGRCSVYHMRLFHPNTELVRGPINVWDRANRFNARFAHAQFGAVTEDVLLAGDNIFAVQTTQGWEVLQAREMTLIGENLYQFSDLIRGLGGSDTEMDDVVEIGAQIVALGHGFGALDIPPDFIGAEISYTATSAGRDSAPVSQIYTALHLRPRKPVHVKLAQEGENWVVSWIRQTRLGGDNWAARDVPLGEDNERYRVRVLAGDIVLSETETETPNVSVAMVETADAIDVSQGSDLYGYGPSVKIPIVGAE